LPVDFYHGVLYPLQDRALAALKGTPFYLTGGTALSRGYYHHRYSDDIDLFVNHLPGFPRDADLAIDALRQTFADLEVSLREKNYVRLYVGGGRLKIELVNDVPSHVGTIVELPVLGRVDSRENIFANKISAMIDRSLPKDIADLYVLLQDGLNLKRALTDASSKAAGITPLLLAKNFAEFDYSLLDREVRWITPHPGNEVRNYLHAVADSIVHGRL
jgi:hypothetical protein